MKHATLLFALALLTLTTACSDLSDTLGFGRNPPDEFAVVDRPPLSLPPDFELRPPQPGAPRPQEVNPTKRASNTLFGANAKLANMGERTFLEGKPETDEISSDSEKAILEAAGTARADPNIREVVDREAAQKIVGSRHLVDEVLWWRKSESSAPTVDAAAEAERIKEAKEKGEPLNKGATPIIERRKSGWIGL